MGARFEKRRLLSRSEAYVLYAAERAINTEADLNWRVMAQVSLGEVLSSPDARAYSAINSKRVDLLIVSRSGDPIAAIEYQGHGHYQGTAAARDAVKKEALRKAGVRYIEVTPESGPEDGVDAGDILAKGSCVMPSDFHKLVSASAAQLLRNTIREARGNEVFFLAKPDEHGVVIEVTPLARGNDSAVPALLQVTSPGDVVIHNHPSGYLTPSSADVSLASEYGNQGVGFYIINNEADDLYVVVEAFKRQQLLLPAPEQRQTTAPATNSPLARAWRWTRKAS
jgi:proteasome lid subunit RPN8/RPN11